MRVWPLSKPWFLSNVTAGRAHPLCHWLSEGSPPSHLAVSSVIELLLFAKVWRVKQAIYLPAKPLGCGLSSP